MRVGPEKYEKGRRSKKKDHSLRFRADTYPEVVRGGNKLTPQLGRTSTGDNASAGPQMLVLLKVLGNVGACEWRNG
ncbi:hypothetical protein M413DRAFT_448735 [Hebeloma cylindrosporum]|uniref:Uncharacterized protein n=1 Tax=Hebeloma cylindrosporum TaxID=76867 RepID=A0A0C2XGG5_HEBCY|nr:hypothetical protein M413DRAFT_448735 [Hebeloma cylindrosporum h7]